MTVLERIDTIKEGLTMLMADVEAKADDEEATPIAFQHYSNLLLHLDQAKRGLRSASFEERVGSKLL